MKTITIIAGSHGVGKISFLGALQGILEYIPDIIDEDKVLPVNGNTRQTMYKAVCDLVSGEINWDLPVTLKTTLFPKLRPLLAWAKEEGYRIEMNYIALSSLEDCISRVQNRVQKGGRDVSPEEIRASFDQRWEMLSCFLPVCDEILFYNNDNGFEAIGRYMHGEFVPISKKLPSWWDEMLCDFNSMKDGEKNAP